MTVTMATAAGVSCGIDPLEPPSDSFFSVVASFLFSADVESSFSAIVVFTVSFFSVVVVVSMSTVFSVVVILPSVVFSVVSVLPLVVFSVGIVLPSSVFSVIVVLGQFANF